MACDSVWRDRIILAASGEEPETQGHRSHLAVCPECRQVYRDLKTLGSIRLPQPAISQTVHNRILAVACEEARKRRQNVRPIRTWMPQSWPRLAWAAIFLAVAGFGFWQYHERHLATTDSALLSTEEIGYGLASVELDLRVLESEMELSMLDIS
ncbi:MAG TPA: hypothetical protein PLQ35_00945 [bacterium]|nr:hypothetical protein [bacterium]HQL60837.1 hypothetical protein [bacterium]